MSPLSPTSFEAPPTRSDESNQFTIAIVSNSGSDGGIVDGAGTISTFTAETNPTSSDAAQTNPTSTNTHRTTETNPTSPSNTHHPHNFINITFRTRQEAKANPNLTISSKLFSSHRYILSATVQKPDNTTLRELYQNVHHVSCQVLDANTNKEVLVNTNGIIEFVFLKGQNTNFVSKDATKSVNLKCKFTNVSYHLRAFSESLVVRVCLLDKDDNPLVTATSSPITIYSRRTENSSQKKRKSRAQDISDSESPVRRNTKRRRISQQGGGESGAEEEGKGGGGKKTKNASAAGDSHANTNTATAAGDVNTTDTNPSRAQNAGSTHVHPVFTRAAGIVTNTSLTMVSRATETDASLINQSIIFTQPTTHHHQHSHNQSSLHDSHSPPLDTRAEITALLDRIVQLRQSLPVEDNLTVGQEAWIKLVKQTPQFDSSQVHQDVFDTVSPTTSGAVDARLMFHIKDNLSSTSSVNDDLPGTFHPHPAGSMHAHHSGAYSVTGPLIPTGPRSTISSSFFKSPPQSPVSTGPKSIGTSSNIDYFDLS